MNKTQSNKFTSYTDSLLVLTHHSDVWSTNQAAADVIGQITANVEKMESMGVVKSKDTTGTTTTKNEQKETMARHASILAATGYAYASRIKNSILQALFDYSYSSLENVSDNVSILRCKSIHDALVPLLSDLASAGITQADLNALLSDIDKFKQSVGYKSTTKGSSVINNVSLASLFDETDDLFSEQLDKLLLRYSLTHTEFHEAYENARKLRKLGVRHSKEEEVEVK